MGIVTVTNYIILGSSVVFGLLALLGVILYKKRVFKVDTIRTFTQFMLVILLNFTVIGNLYISPLLPTLRLDIPKLMERGPLKACPMAIIQRVFTDQWTAIYLIAVLAFLLIVVLVVGRGLCAWSCPVGLMQDLLNKLRNFFRIRSLEPSQKMNNNLNSVRFAVLFFFLLLSLSIGIAAVWNDTSGALFRSYLPAGTAQQAPFCAFCPTPSLYYVFTVMIGVGLQFQDPIHYILWPIVFYVVVGSFLVPRFWCRYFCPVGAISSFGNKVSLLHVQKDHKKCTKCNVCYTHCPTRVEAVQDEDVKGRVDDLNCIYCGECVERCYEKALTIDFGPVTIYRGGQSWEKTLEQKGKGKT